MLWDITTMDREAHIFDSFTPFEINKFRYSWRRLQSQLILSLSENGRALPADWRDRGARSVLSLAHLL